MLKMLIESTEPQLNDHVEEFCQFVYNKLGIITPPSISFVERTGLASFGNYQPSSGAIVVATQGRHMCDVFRTVAHEIVHAKQMEEGDIATRPLLDLEWEANAIAGMLLRNANQEHPGWYGVDSSESEPGTLGDSQGAVFPDTTRPSGPINMAEEGIVNSTGSGAIAELYNRTLNRYRRAALAQIRHTHFPKASRLAKRKKGFELAGEKLSRRRRPFQEEMTAGAGDVAGLGIGPQGEPGVTKKKSPILAPMVRRKTFKQLREAILKK